MKKEHEQKQNEALNKTDVRSRFFAQYFGVRVFQNDLNKRYDYPTYKYPMTIEREFKDQVIEYLELKPLSKITDEDREYCVSIGDGRIYKNFQQNQVDFLRSKGYAIPFMNFSVEDLVSFGWMQLS